MKKLLFYILNAPKEEDSEANKYKIPFVSSEVLNCNIFEILRYFPFESTEEENLLPIFFRFIKTTDELPDLLCGYFGKFFATLLNRNILGLLKYLRNDKEIISSFLYHSYNESILQSLHLIINNQSGLEQDLEYKSGVYFVIDEIFAFVIENLEKIHELEKLHLDSVAQILLDLSFALSSNNELLSSFLKSTKLQGSILNVCISSNDYIQSIRKHSLSIINVALKQALISFSFKVQPMVGSSLKALTNENSEAAEYFKMDEEIAESEVIDSLFSSSLNEQLCLLAVQLDLVSSAEKVIIANLFENAIAHYELCKYSFEDIFSDVCIRAMVSNKLNMMS